MSPRFSAKTPKYSGVDSWVPADNNEIAEIPKNVLDKYKKVHPNIEAPQKFVLKNGEFTVLTCAVADKPKQVKGADESRTKKLTNSKLNKTEVAHSQSDSAIKEKEKATEKDTHEPLHHLAIKLSIDDGQKYVMSLYRSSKMSDVVALCERCRENPELFRVFPKDVVVKDFVNLIFNELRENMTWKSVHIAAKIGFIEFFRNMKEHKLGKNFNVIAQPEGLSPLMLAIQNDQLETCSLMMEKGADITYVCPDGSNALHIAATSSVEMIKLLWETKKCDEMLNKADASGNTPMYVALTNGYLSNARYLKAIGASLTAIDATHEATPLIGALKKGKLDDSTIKKILEMKPDALNETEPITGNTVLHCAVNKKSIILLLGHYKDQCNARAVNSLKQTPLHIFVSRDDVSLVMTLAAYGVDVNAADCNGNTPLHLAVTKGSVAMTRTLLCLGADPNVVNHYKESPRHIAAKSAEQSKAMDLVRSLIICGATACAKGFVGCAFGCMHRDSLGACRQHINGNHKKYDTDKANVERNVDSIAVDSEATTAPYEFVLDPDTHVVEEAYAEKNDIRSFPHKLALERVKAKLKECAEKKKASNLINVLALDGGGIRGLVTVQMLLSVEALLDEPLINYFDWIGATSTGCYIMSTLLTGQTLRQAQWYYLQFKDQLFDSWSRPYDTTTLEKFIKCCFGENLKMSDIEYPKIFCTTVRADTFPVQLDLNRSYRLPISAEENEELGFADPKDMTLWKACRRSSAAPTYFSASEGKYIDGGMISNNPTLDILSEICFWNSTCQKTGHTSKMVDVGCVLSVGTGITPVCPVDPSLFEMNNIMGVLRGIMNLSLVVIDQATATEGAPITRSRSWCHSLGYPYYRLNAPLFKDIFLDSNDDMELAKVMWDSVVYAHTHRKDFEEVANLLKLIGTNKERREHLKL
ncbi:unnamed protein product [Caenorhabditis bovis]|uniref:phospholipase A2 n=1 Tax=Caenorhabditis bovis TaxID=2654633 RepID=A0A8S1EA77_9PELO|nr:unnamed protein product [Caenorhabditis bovis]